MVVNYTWKFCWLVILNLTFTAPFHVSCNTTKKNHVAIHLKQNKTTTTKNHNKNQMNCSVLFFIFIPTDILHLCDNQKHSQRRLKPSSFARTELVCYNIDKCEISSEQGDETCTLLIKYTHTHFSWTYVLIYDYIIFKWSYFHHFLSNSTDMSKIFYVSYLKHKSMSQTLQVHAK